MDKQVEAQSVVVPVEAGLAEAAGVLAAPVELTRGEDGLEALIEARLAKEVRDFIGSFEEFGRRFQAVRKAAVGCELGENIALVFELFCGQFAYSFFKIGDSMLPLSEYGQQLDKLGLRLDQAFRESELDGRKFLCIALMDEPAWF